MSYSNEIRRICYILIWDNVHDITVKKLSCVIKLRKSLKLNKTRTHNAHTTHTHTQ